MITNDVSTCPKCGGDLKYYDRVTRIVRTKGRKTWKIPMRRLQCTRCGSVHSSLEFEDANEEQRLFYDSFSKRYFQATISQVLQAEYHINRNMVLGAFVTLNDFYDFLGISHVEGGDVVGWLLSDSMYWIDFDNSKAMVDDGLNGEIPCYVVDAMLGPQPESEWDY